MNHLAEIQKKMYEPNISAEEYEKRKEEFLNIYFEYRNKEEQKWYSKCTLEQRKKFHNAILKTYKLKNRLGRFTYEVIKDEREKTNRPIIFVGTHVGKFDIEVSSEAIRDHYYLLSGDFEHIEGIIDSPFLGLNGVYYFNEIVKEDRIKVSKDMIKHLQNSGNLLYFIEGTWNLTPNLPLLPCYWGIVDIAKKGNAIIIPVAMEQYDKHFKINIGKNFDMLKYEDSLEEKGRAIQDLRDTLATLKWEIWETKQQKRKDIKENEWKEYIDKRFSEWPYFNKEYIQRLIFRPKNEVYVPEVFNQIENLNLSNCTNEDFALKLILRKDAEKRIHEYEEYHF